jgi:hypothetical protein
MTPDEKKRRAAAIIAYVNERDSGARDLRDAAHEAHHALAVELEGSWERERLHHAMVRRGRSYLLQSEIEARAVEQLVCVALDVAPGKDIAGWALVSCFEAIKTGLDIGPPEPIERAIERAMKRDSIRAAADRVLALGDEEKR